MKTVRIILTRDLHKTFNILKALNGVRDVQWHLSREILSSSESIKQLSSILLQWTSCFERAVKKPRFVTRVWVWRFEFRGSTMNVWIQRFDWEGFNTKVQCSMKVQQWRFGYEGSSTKVQTYEGMVTNVWI